MFNTVLAQNSSVSRKQSRLNMKAKDKVVTVSYQDEFGKKTKKSIQFTNDIEVPKAGKSVNQYFANRLIPKIQADKSQETVVVVNKSNAVVEKVEAKPANQPANTETSNKFYKAEGIFVSNVYPNPADDFGFFECSIENKYNKLLKIVVYNAIGGVTGVSINLSKEDKKVKIPLKTLPNGIYFYQLMADGKTVATKKLLVRHN